MALLADKIELKSLPRDFLALSEPSNIMVYVRTHICNALSNLVKEDHVLYLNHVNKPLNRLYIFT